jgi:hypothetical protein
MARNPNPYSNPPTVALSFLQNYRVPYLLCPVCGQHPLKVENVPFLTCNSHHQFYKCPTCMDTRVSDIRENIIYCGLLHPYHLCAVHKIPVVGTAQFVTKCTCHLNPRSVTRQREVPNWESPFV